MKVIHLGKFSCDGLASHWMYATCSMVALLAKCQVMLLLWILWLTASRSPDPERHYDSRFTWGSQLHTDGVNAHCIVETVSRRAKNWSDFSLASNVHPYQHSLPTRLRSADTHLAVMAQELLHGLVPVHDQLPFPLKFRGQYMHTNVYTAGFADRKRCVIEASIDTVLRCRSSSKGSNIASQVRAITLVSFNTNLICSQNTSAVPNQHSALEFTINLSQVIVH
jgi:hypothetical protein